MVLLSHRLSLTRGTCQLVLTQLRGIFQAEVVSINIIQGSPNDAQGDCGVDKVHS